MPFYMFEMLVPDAMQTQEFELIQKTKYPNEAILLSTVLKAFLSNESLKMAFEDCPVSHEMFKSYEEYCQWYIDTAIKIYKVIIDID